MTARPLSYPSLTTVLQHIEANQRFLLATRLPSIRCAEKSVPLKLEYLEFSGTSFIVVNNQRYWFGVYKKYPDVVDQKRYDESNRYGESSDLDQWGDQDWTSRGTVAAGDIDLKSMRFEVDQENKDRNNQRMHEKVIKLQREYQEIEDRENAPSDPKRPRIQNYLESKKSRLAEEIKTILYDLEPFYNERDGLKPKFTPYIQLTVTPISYMEQVEYGITPSFKLNDAEKYLNTKFFGNRRHSLIIKHLSICHNIIIRLPLGIKLLIREMTHSGNMALLYNSMHPVFDERSFPLKCLTTRVDYGPQDYSHPIVRYAEYLEIVETDANWLEVIANLQCKTVYKMIDDGSMSTEHYISLIEFWQQFGRPEGTCYSFGIEHTEKLRHILKTTARWFNVRRMSEGRFIRIPSIPGKIVQVGFEKAQRGGEQWILQLEVIGADKF